MSTQGLFNVAQTLFFSMSAAISLYVLIMAGKIGFSHRVFVQFFATAIVFIALSQLFETEGNRPGEMTFMLGAVALLLLAVYRETRHFAKPQEFLLGDTDRIERHEKKS